jgi:hypothetical protein
MNLRAPAVSHGLTSFLWAVFFGVLILIFLFVRVYGEDEPPRPA